MKKSLVAFSVVLTVVGSLSLLGLAQSPTPSDSEAVATITKMENDAVKADLAADASFYQNYLADDWTGGTSRGTWTASSHSHRTSKTPRTTRRTPRASAI